MARLIDADEMIKGICFIIGDSKELLTSSVVRKAMLGLVDRIKTVDAAPVVHGRWVKKNDQGVFYCSECDLPSLQWWPYCEKCGAKMETEISNITKKKFAPSLDDAIKEFNAKWTISGTKMDGGEDVDVGEKASAD